MGATCEVFKVKHIREIQELFRYELRAVIANDNFRNTISSEYWFAIVNNTAWNCCLSMRYIYPSEIIINDL